MGTCGRIIIGWSDFALDKLVKTSGLGRLTLACSSGWGLPALACHVLCWVTDSLSVAFALTARCGGTVARRSGMRIPGGHSLGEQFKELSPSVGFSISPFVGMCSCYLIEFY